MKKIYIYKYIKYIYWNHFAVHRKLTQYCIGIKFTVIFSILNFVVLFFLVFQIIQLKSLSVPSII